MTDKKITLKLDPYTIELASVAIKFICGVENLTLAEALLINYILQCNATNI